MSEDNGGSEFAPRTTRLDKPALVWVEWMLVIAFLGVLAAMGFMFQQLQDLRDLQLEDRRDLVANRVVTCRALVALGVELTGNGPCGEVRQAGLFDPATVKRQVTEKDLMHMLCRLEEFKADPPDMCSELD